MRVFSTLRFVLKRSWHRRSILFPVMLATLGVITILAGVPQFSDAATNFGLQSTLDAPAPAAERNLDILISRPALTANAYQQLSDETTSSAHAHLGKLLPPQAPIRRGETPALAIYPPGTPAGTPPGQELNPANLWFVSGADTTHLKLLAGRLPAATVSSAQTPQGPAWDVEAMLTPDWAETFGLKLNDVLTAADGTRAPGGYLRIHIVGIFQPRSLKDPIWFDDLDPFTPPLAAANQPLPPTPLWLNEAAFHLAIPELGLQRNTNYTWMYYLNLKSILPATVPHVVDQIIAFKGELNTEERGILFQRPSVTVLTRLDLVLEAFLEQLFFVTVVTLVTILPGILLLLYYLGIAAAALAEQSREDMALMQSRGASRWQVLSLLLLEAVLLSGAALLAAPWLSGQVVVLLAHQGLFSPPPGQASVGIPSFQAYLYASVGALICLLTMLLPGWAALRTSLLAIKRHFSRPRPRALWLRIGPGFLLTALGVFGYLQIRTREAFFTQSLHGDFTIDWVAAVSPTLLLLGIAGLGSLLVPPLLLLGDWLFHRLPGVAASLAFRQMARRPGPYIRLLLLLSLTAALGVSASLFTGSLDNSFNARASYVSGADLRLVEGSLNLPDIDWRAAPLQDHLTLLPGVRDGMSSFRAESILPLESLHFPQTTVLGIDSTRFAQLAYWRPDFASAPLPRLMQSLQREGTQEEALPAIIDDQLLNQARLHVGSQIIMDIGGIIGVNFQVVGTFHYFPTLDTSGYTLVCDMNRLITVLHQILSPNIAPNEIWLQLAPNAPAYTAGQVENRLETNPQHRQVLVSVLQAYDRQELAETLRNDPLQRSISTALTLDFIIAALLSVVGMIALFLLLAQQRAFEFGVLRAMGLSLGQLLWMLGCEQLTLLLLAGLLGIPLGLVVAGVTLPSLSTDESGIPLLPPLADTFNAQLLIQQGLFLLACLLAAAAATTLIFRRLRLHATLQLGEE
jgi:putative ABC transport system permease protein